MHLMKQLGVENNDANLPEIYSNVGSSTKPPSVVNKNFKCTIENCEKAYNKPCKLAAHIRSHNGERPFQCLEPGCGKSFIRKGNLQAHMNSHIEPRRRPIACTELDCTQRFATNQHMKQHRKLIHETRQVYHCVNGACTESFRKSCQLKRHIEAVHSNSDSHLCLFADCQRTFRHKYMLDRHVERVHDNPKSYVCAVDGCHETYLNWSSLQKHLKDHPHKCKVCGTCFDSTPQLAEHAAVHDLIMEQRRQFPCPVQGCPKTFMKSFSMKKHVSSVHEGLRPFKCSEPNCRADFIHKKSLTEHIHKEHSMVIRESRPRRKSRRLANVMSGLDKLTGREEGHTDDFGVCLVNSLPGRRKEYTSQYDLERNIIFANHSALETQYSNRALPEPCQVEPNRNHTGDFTESAISGTSTGVGIPPFNTRPEVISLTY